MRPSFLRRVVAAGAVVLLGVGLAGCSDDKQGDDPATEGAATPGAQSLDLTKPIAEAEYTVPGSTDDKVTVGVLLLEQQGDLQMLHLVITPDFRSVAKNEEVELDDMLDADRYSGHFQPRLVDRENLKIYGAVRQSPDSALTVNSEPLYVYAAFAAPQDDTKTYDLVIRAEWQPITIEAPQR